jgi:hypothetical protein
MSTTYDEEWLFVNNNTILKVAGTVEYDVVMVC